MKKKKSEQKKQHLLQREGSVFMIALASFAGSSTFYYTFSALTGYMLQDWWVVSMIITLFSLPLLYKNLECSTHPYLVQLAIAFRAGFMVFANMFVESPQADDLLKRISNRGNDNS